MNKSKNLKSLNFYNVNMASLLLRIGLAAVFVYAAVSAFLTPNAWLSYIPDFTTKYVSAKVSLDVMSVFQLVLAAVLISGKYLKYAAALSVLILTGILLFSLNELLITFRDIGLIFMAAALIFLDK